MASTIKLKNGSGAPLASALVQGEPAFDLTNKRLYTENASGTVIEVGTNPAAEITANGGIALPDNQKATFGAGDDLQIYHDSNNSFIKDVGTGDLYIAADNLRLTNSAATEFYAKGVTNGAFSLYYDGSEKLATTATGIDVTGTVVSDGLTVAGQSALNDIVTVTSTNPRFRLIESDTTNLNTDIRNSGGDFQVSTINDSVDTVTPRFAIDHATGDISFYEDTGTTAKFFWDASAESLGIGTASPSTTLELVASGAFSAASGNTTFTGVGLHISPSGTTPADGLQYGAITWGEPNPSFGNYQHAAIAPVQDTSDSNQVGLSFLIHSSATRSDNLNEAMRIDSSGNVGIGTTSPSCALDVFDNAGSLSATKNVTARFRRDDGTNNPRFEIRHSTDGTDLHHTFSTIASNFTFSIGNSEKARIDSSGNLLVGKTTLNSATTVGLELQADGQIFSIADGRTAGTFVRKTSDGSIVDFRKDSTTVGSISVTASTTAYNITSDERLKENITDAPAGNIDAIKVRSFDWKANGEHQDYGMVAQELEAVAPYAVTKGETEEDMWSVDYSKLVPMLIKEIQDLKAEVAALKGAN